MSQYSKHFTVKELACPLTGEVTLAPGFIEGLEKLREAYGRPMHVTSACRSPNHNNKVGGSQRSLHLTAGGLNVGGCAAVDIVRPNAADLHTLIAEAMMRRWSVGIHGDFIHLDWRAEYGITPVVFGY